LPCRSSPIERASGVPQVIVLSASILSAVSGAEVDEISMSARKSARPSKSTVFVVHGRDTDARRAMFTFLRAIGLLPIEWVQAIAATATGTPFIGDVLDAAFEKAAAVVVLLTGDDEGRLLPQWVQLDDPLHERELTPQARQNVIFEAGMAFGRYPAQTILVELGAVRPMSDIAGRHAVRLGNSPESRAALAQRLKCAGCAVDLSGTDWLAAGDFSKGTGSAQHSQSTFSDEEISILLALANQGSKQISCDSLAKKLKYNVRSKPRFEGHITSLRTSRLIALSRLSDGTLSPRLLLAGRKLLLDRKLL
jgi:predicted nucleotide-binding protein